MAPRRVLVVLLLVLPAAGLRADEPFPDPPLPVRRPSELRPRELLALLDEPIDTAAFRGPMTLKDALGELYDQLAARGKRVPILINSDAFKEENPDSPDPYENQVKLPPAFPHIPLGRALRLLVGQIPTSNGTFIIRPGHYEITTNEQSGPRYLLRQRIDARFELQTVATVLEDVFDRTGVAVVVDARFAYRARTIVSAKFTNNVDLETALGVVLEMADLQLVAVHNVLYATSPANARRIWWEQRRRQNAPSYGTPWGLIE